MWKKSLGLGVNDTLGLVTLQRAVLGGEQQWPGETREKGKRLHPLLETQRESSRKANGLSLRNADRDCHEALRSPHEDHKAPRLEFT